jgi:hypothetical protein
MICIKCSKEIDSADKHCRYCGALQKAAAPFFYTRTGIWLLFLLIGPLNLFFLFLSPVIARKWKIIDGALTILISAAIIHIIYLILMYIYNLYSTYLNISI